MWDWIHWIVAWLRTEPRYKVGDIVVYTTLILQEKRNAVVRGKKILRCDGKDCYGWHYDLAVMEPAENHPSGLVEVFTHAHGVEEEALRLIG